MTDNEELYSVIGSILKEFKLEIVQSLKDNESVNVKRYVDNRKLIEENGLSILNMTNSINNTIDELNLKFSEHVKNIDIAFENISKVSVIVDSISDDIIGVIGREETSKDYVKAKHIDLKDSIGELSDALNDKLEKHFIDSVEFGDLIKQDITACDEKIGEQSKLLKADYVALSKDLNESFKEAITGQEFDEVVANQQKEADILKEEISTLKAEIESSKQEVDDYCKIKLDSQYELLKLDYTELKKQTDESFKNTPSTNDLYEIAADQQKESDSLKEEISTLKAEIELHKQNNIDLLDETKQYIDESLPSLKGEKGSLDRVTAWQKDYPREINQVVTHNNCLWQLKYNDSNESPGSGDDWRLLIAGLVNIEIEPGKENKTNIVMIDGSGKKYKDEITLPVPNMLGTWDDETNYKFYDNVAKDGCRWITHKDDPKGKPGESKDWHIASLKAVPGKKGLKGDTGDKGEQGISGYSPTRQEIITIINEDS